MQNSICLLCSIRNRILVGADGFRNDSKGTPQVILLQLTSMISLPLLLRLLHRSTIVPKYLPTSAQIHEFWSFSLTITTISHPFHVLASTSAVISRSVLNEIATVDRYTVCSGSSLNIFSVEAGK